MLIWYIASHGYGAVNITTLNSHYCRWHLITKTLVMKRKAV